jgi:esterase/lipase superfamily enzyme
VDARTIGRDGFVSALRPGRDSRVVLFVHGYSYGFDRGCRRVSDLQVVLGDSVQVVLFSWPSAGNPLRYGGDRKALRASTPSLASTLRLLVDAVGSPRLTIAAHSMGAFGVMEALERFDTTGPGTLAADLVLIAPDVDVESFRARFPSVRDHFGRVTLYTSANDILLGFSSLLNGVRRLGQGGDKALVLRGLETVDVSRLPRHHPAAHEYQYYNPHVVTDLVELLRDGKGAAQRSGTVARGQGDERYWVLRERAVDP